MKVTLKASVDIDKSTITISQLSAFSLEKHTIDTKDILFRDCLVLLGWTPPQASGKSTGLTEPRKPTTKKQRNL